MTYETIEIRKLSPIIGAEVLGVDARSHPLAMASRRGLREDQRRDALSTSTGPRTSLRHGFAATTPTA